MTGGQGGGFGRLPVRVAAVTTAIVAVVYLVAAWAMVVISGNNLVANIDDRLAQQLSFIQSQPDVVSEVIGGGGGADLDNDGDARRFDAPLVVWLRGPGRVGLPERSDRRPAGRARLTPAARRRRTSAAPRCASSADQSRPPQGPAG